MVAWAGFGPEVLRQQATLMADGVHLRDKDDIERWVSLWERAYGSPIIVPVNPFEALGLRI